MRQHPYLVAALVSAALACGERSPEASSQLPDELPASQAEGWHLTLEGLGPLRSGMTLEEARAAAGGSFALPEQAPAAACSYAEWPGAPPGVRVMFEDGRLARVEVDSATPALAQGLRVGDGVETADSLFGARATRRPHQYVDGEYLIVLADPAGDTLQRLVVEVVNGRVMQLRVGRYPPVEYVEGCS